MRRRNHLRTVLLLGVALAAPSLFADEELPDPGPGNDPSTPSATESPERPQRARRERGSEPAPETLPAEQASPGQQEGQPTPEDVARQVITGEIHQSAISGGPSAAAREQAHAAAAPTVSGSQTDPEMAVLFFNPATVSVTEGEEFVTELILSNPRGLAFDHASLTILFNSSALEPLGEIPGTAIGEADLLESGVDEDTGLLRISCSWAEAHDSRLAHIITLVWQARTEVRATDVSFLREGMGETFVGLIEGGSILGNATRSAPGLIASTVRISPDLGFFLPEESEIGDLPWIDPTDESAAPSTDVEVALRSEVDAVGRGDVFDVDVTIRNPSGQSADNVRFRLNFDSESLEVIDTHDGNWIEQGINIWDGDYHAVFPFDLHVANLADNDRGVIEYWMGFTGEMPLPSGTVATIRFRALRPSLGVNIEFDPEGTSIRFLGEELVTEEGLTGLSLPIGSRPAARATAAGEPTS